MKTTFHFLAEDESVLIGKKQVSVDTTGHDLGHNLFVTLAVIFIGKTLICEYLFKVSQL